MQISRWEVAAGVKAEVRAALWAAVSAAAWVTMEWVTMEWVTMECAEAPWVVSMVMEGAAAESEAVAMKAVV